MDTKHCPFSKKPCFTWACQGCRIYLEVKRELFKKIIRINRSGVCIDANN